MLDKTVSLTPAKAGFWKLRSLSRAPALRARGAEDETTANVRSAAIVMLVAFAVFLALDSEGLRHVARDLPGNAVSDALVAAADRWHAAMQGIGLARLAPAIREGFETLRDIGW